MAEYYHLYVGAAKSRMNLVMTDVLSKVENYRDALKGSSGHLSKYRFMRIDPAGNSADVFRQKNSGGGWGEHTDKPLPAIARGKK